MVMYIIMKICVLTWYSIFCVRHVYLWTQRWLSGNVFTYWSDVVGWNPNNFCHVLDRPQGVLSPHVNMSTGFRLLGLPQSWDLKQRTYVLCWLAVASNCTNVQITNDTRGVTYPSSAHAVSRASHMPTSPAPYPCNYSVIYNVGHTARCSKNYNDYLGFTPRKLE